MEPFVVALMVGTAVFCGTLKTVFVLQLFEGSVIKTVAVPPAVTAVFVVTFCGAQLYEALLTLDVAVISTRGLKHVTVPFALAVIVGTVLLRITLAVKVTATEFE